MQKYSIGVCNMEIKRDHYLNKLILKKHNGLIKVVTGIRRCGKSYLLFTLFKSLPLIALRTRNTVILRYSTLS